MIGYKQCIGKNGCGKIKPINKFVEYDACTGDGHRGICVECNKKIVKIRHEKNKERDAESKRKYIRNNPEKRKESLFSYKTKQCKEGDFCILSGFKQCVGKYGCKEIKSIDEFVINPKRKDGHNGQCIECNKKRDAMLREINKDRIKKSNKRWRSKNKEKIKEKWQKRKYIDAQRRKERIKEEPLYVLKMTLRSRFNKIMRKMKTGEKKIRGELVFEYLQCSIEKLKKHIEYQFYPHPETGEVMAWSNHGTMGWHIDHIIPFDSIKDDRDTKQIKKVCYYKNLQPLWGEHNRSKSNKMLTKQEINNLKKIK